MIRKISSVLAITATLLVMCAGCGGAGTTVKPVTAPEPAGTATTPKPIAAGYLVLGIKGSLAPGVTIGGVDVTLELPEGVTVRADKTGATMPGALAAIGAAAGSLSIGKFTPADGATPAKLRMALINPTGFTLGEVAAVNLELSGPLPEAGKFKPVGFKVNDSNAINLQGLTPTITFQSR